MGTQPQSQTVLGTVVDVTFENKNTSRGPSKLYTVEVLFAGEQQNRKLKTWQDSRALEAHSFKGRQAAITFSVKPPSDPKYAPELMIDKVEDPTAAAAGAAGIGQTIPGGGAQTFEPAPGPQSLEPAATVVPAPAEQTMMPAGPELPQQAPDRHDAIRRGGVAKVAAVMFGYSLQPESTLTTNAPPGTWEAFLEIFKKLDELVESGELIPF